MAYQRNFLSKVIFQASFKSIEPITRILDETVSAKCENITGAKRTEQKSTNINLNAALNQVSTNNFSRWVFVGDVISINIQSDFIQVITSKYKEYTAFHPLISEIFQTFKDVYNPEFNRIALRYINNINLNEGNTFDFNELVHPSLLGATLEFKEESLSRSMGSMVLNERNLNIITNFNYGFYNSQYPALISKREFILDFDTFYVINERDQIQEILMNLRNRINFLFEKSILPGLRNLMNKA